MQAERVAKGQGAFHGFRPKAGASIWCENAPEQLPTLDMEQGHPQLIMRRGLLSPDQCQALIDCFERCIDTCGAQSDDEFWDGRFIWQDKLPPHEAEALRITQQARLVIQLELILRLRPPVPLFSDTAQIVRWGVGQALTPHADNIEPDGRPNATPHRSLSSIVYLNDDYEGGETFYPGLGFKVRPERGTLVAFGAGPSHVHGVTAVTSGLRYTYAGWFTFDASWEDKVARKVY